jgi:hypothetical protein
MLILQNFFDMTVPSICVSFGQTLILFTSNRDYETLFMAFLLSFCGKRKFSCVLLVTDFDVICFLL